MHFEKFPKIPHLKSAFEEGLLPNGTYWVTEKFDGANAGIQRTPEGLVLHSRNSFLAFFGEDGSERVESTLSGFVEYVRPHVPYLLRALEAGDHLYGEWLVPHTVAYPAAMYRQFYVFPETVRARSTDDALAFPFPTVEVLGTAQFYGDLESLVGRLDELAEQRMREQGREIEGLVAYHPDSGQRFKRVRPKFREEAARRWKGVDKGVAIEDSLAKEYPQRAYEKLAQKLTALKDRPLTKADTPEVLARAWDDYLEEFFPKALKRHNLPTVDTRRLLKSFQQRIREVFHSQLDTGEYPAWFKEHCPAEAGSAEADPREMA